MKTHSVYIITDSNRAYLEVGYCADMEMRIQEIRYTPPILFSNTPKLRNVVYIETFQNKEKALAFQGTLRHFTRMQREKLIRLKNPNWLNLYQDSFREEHIKNKKVAVYA